MCPTFAPRTSSMRMATIESTGVITSDTSSSLRLMPRAWLTRTGRSPRMSVVVTRPTRWPSGAVTNSERTAREIMYSLAACTGADGSIVTAATLARSVITSSAGESSVTGLAAGCASAHAPLAAREMDARG